MVMTENFIIYYKRLLYQQSETFSSLTVALKKKHTWKKLFQNIRLHLHNSSHSLPA